MAEGYRPELTRRFLHWIEGERWCVVCQAWAPLQHDQDHPPLPEGMRPRPRRRHDDSSASSRPDDRPNRH